MYLKRMVPLHALLKQNTRYHGNTNSVVFGVVPKKRLAKQAA